MNALIFIRPLTETEQQEIQAGLRSSSAFVLRRRQILLAGARQKHARAIAKQLGCDDQIVRNVIKGFNERGLSVLKRRYCRPHHLRTRIPDEALEALQDLLQRSLWSLPLVAQVSFEQGIIPTPTSLTSVCRAPKRLGTSWKRARALGYQPRSTVSAEKTHVSG